MNRWRRPVNPHLAEALQAGAWQPAGPLAAVPFVVFDTETTGFHPFGGDAVIAVAARRFPAGAEFATLVDPGRLIPPLICDLTGITNEAVRGAPSLVTVLEPFFRFVSRSVLVAHCADFDRSFLEAGLRKTAGLRWVHPLLDTQALAEALFPTWRDYRLEHCATMLQTPVEGRHTAPGDVLTTCGVLEALLAEANRRGLRTWGQLSNLLHQRLTW